MTRRLYDFDYPFPPSRVVEFYRTYFGPVKRAFAALDENGQAALREDLEQLWATHNSSANGATHVGAELLEVVAVRG